MKDVYAIYHDKDHLSVRERLPFALKNVWNRILPYSLNGVFWAEGITPREKEQIEKLGYRIMKIEGKLIGDFIFYNRPLDKLDFNFIPSINKLTRQGIGLVMEIKKAENERTFLDFVEYLKKGIGLFNGHVFGGGTKKDRYFLTGFIPYGNIYLIQQTIHVMKMALEVYDLYTKSIFYLARYDSIEYSGKEILIMDRHFIDFIRELENLKDFQIAVERQLIALYPSINTGIMLKPTSLMLLNRKFNLVEGVFRAIETTDEFSDREKELNYILSILIDSLKGRKQVISIQGNYGIGKTTLVFQILKDELLVKEKVRTYYLKFERGYARPLYGVKRLFESLSPPPDFGVPPTDPLYMSIRLAYIVFKQLMKEDSPELDKEINPANKINLIKLGLLKYFEHVTHPAVFVLDDVELMDEVSRQIIFDVINSDTGEDRPVSFIVVSRKKVLLDLLKNAKHIELGPLPYSSNNIPEKILKSKVDEKVKEYIYRVGEGQPFYMEQLTKFLLDEGYIDEKDGIYIFVKNPPQSLNTEEVIRKRMEHLSESISYILDVATISGATMPISFYTSVLEKEKGILISPNIGEDSILIELLNRLNEIFYISRYAIFKKMRVHEMLASTKEHLHTKIVEVIEEHFNDQIEAFYPILYHHAQKAGMREKELYYLKKLYDEAKRFYIIPDYIKYLKRLIVLDPENRITYLKELAEAYEFQGKWDEADNILSELIKNGKSYKIEDFVYREKCFIETYRGNFEKAHSLIDISLEIARKHGDFEDIAGALLTKGTVYWAQWELERAKEFYHKAMSVLEEHGIENRKCVVYANLGFIYFVLNKYDTAQHWLFEAIKPCKEEKDFAALSNVYGNIAGLYMNERNLKEAKKYAIYAMDIARQKGLLHIEARSHLQLAEVLLSEENGVDEAVKEGEQALSIFKEIGDRLGIFKSLLALGRIAVKRGEKEQAIAHFIHALDEAEPIKNPGLKVEAYLELGKLYDDDKGIKYLSLAYKESQKNDRKMFVMVAIELAKKFKRQGKIKEALRIIKDALYRVEDEDMKRLLKEEEERIKRTP